MSTKVKIIGLVSFCLWVTGSYLIYNETNGKAVSIAVAVIIIAGLYSQIKRSKRKFKTLKQRY